ncbi:hypothetical protein C8Q73DRAFT_85819 [Cubamyces lactineus]|nr:hypothetical protein C8Q73DRAFT_85819 [Cubamyces lactineus]
MVPGGADSSDDARQILTANGLAYDCRDRPGPDGLERRACHKLLEALVTNVARRADGWQDGSADSDDAGLIVMVVPLACERIPVEGASLLLRHGCQSVASALRPISDRGVRTSPSSPTSPDGSLEACASGIRTHVRTRVGTTGRCYPRPRMGSRLEARDVECASESPAFAREELSPPTRLWSARTNPPRIRTVTHATRDCLRVQRLRCGRHVQCWHLSSATSYSARSTTKARNDHKRAVEWDTGLRTRLRDDIFCERKLWAFPRPRIDHEAKVRSGDEARPPVMSRYTRNGRPAHEV